MQIWSTRTLKPQLLPDADQISIEIQLKPALPTSSPSLPRAISVFKGLKGLVQDQLEPAPLIRQHVWMTGPDWSVRRWVDRGVEIRRGRFAKNFLCATKKVLQTFSGGYYSFVVVDDDDDVYYHGLQLH